MPRHAWVPTVALGTLLSFAASADHPVVTIDLYRALSGAIAGAELANNDFASLSGVLSYIHTEVIGENVHGNTNYLHTKPEDRKDRLHAINSILKARFHIHNPDALIDEVGSLYNWVDFGPHCQFEDGKATAGLPTLTKYGDFVGVQQHIDVRYPTVAPFYWFSVSGFCPNLAWSDKGSAASPNRKCLSYEDGSGPLKGGHCPAGTSPSGEQGCVYSYDPIKQSAVVKLDDITGITEEDCGGRKCESFADWRVSCTNSAYKKRFNYSRRRRKENVIKSPVCVEYDIDPVCADNCNSKACKKLDEEEREIGLPFWRGRCNKEANQRRAESLAKAFGNAKADTAHQLVDPAVQKTFASCKVDDPSRMCHPDPEAGGMYCTRTWAGVCAPCYIPNTVKVYPSAGKDPLCPWGILSTPDYKSSDPPKCASNSPRDLCCIYSSTCDESISADPTAAPLDDDGFMLVAAQQDTAAMTTFLSRYAESVGATVADETALSTVAYWQWGPGPVLGRALKDVELGSRSSANKLEVPAVPESDAEQGRDVAASLGVARDAPAAAAANGSPNGAPWLMGLLACLGLVACLAAICVATHFIAGAARKGKRGILFDSASDTESSELSDESASDSTQPLPAASRSPPRPLDSPGQTSTGLLVSYALAPPALGEHLRQYPGISSQSQPAAAPARSTLYSSVPATTLPVAPHFTTWQTQPALRSA